MTIDARYILAALLTASLSSCCSKAELSRVEQSEIDLQNTQQTTIEPPYIVYESEDNKAYLALIPNSDRWIDVRYSPLVDSDDSSAKKLLHEYSFVPDWIARREQCEGFLSAIAGAGNSDGWVPITVVTDAGQSIKGYAITDPLSSNTPVEPWLHISSAVDRDCIRSDGSYRGEYVMLNFHVRGKKSDK